MNSTVGGLDWAIIEERRFNRGCRDVLSVVWTESVQTILLLVGAVVITVVGYLKVGGWSALSATLSSHAHPLASVAGAKVNWGTGNFLNMARTAGDPSGLAWYSILLGYPVLRIWCWCCDQTIVQRVLAARDEKHARLGPLFCAFLKVWPVLKAEAIPLVWGDWREPLRGEAGGRGLGNYRMATAAVLVAFGTLYLIFR